ncbi:MULTISPECIES: acyltransferase family protein [Olivibacter]|uniref:Acyltransferase family protein n=1 Tax=Olivibacter jilunii TaxID=985016 RepID=A0ABW6B3N5_9SPHI
MVNIKYIKNGKNTNRFLDGIRGYSALFVAFYHAMLFTQYKVQYSPNFALNVLQKFTSVGYISVSVFIVLSGYCLAIPVVRNNLQMKGGFKRYIKRRAKRIIPPYYFALLLSILSIIFIPTLQKISGTAWDSKIPINAENIFAHFLLIHNLNRDWLYKINGAHWSVATEWHIYFLFPIMLYLWREKNIFVMLCFFFLLTAFLYKLVPFSSPQFILLFLMGVIAAYFSFNEYRIQVKKIYLYINLLSFIPVLILAHFHFPATPVVQVLFGVLFSIFLFLLVKLRLEGRPSNLDLALSSKVPTFLGKISYSLYLIHGPFLALSNLVLLKHYHLEYDLQLLVMWCIVVPVIIFISYLFYILVERHFLN